MKYFRSRSMAHEVAALLERLTGDRCRIVAHITAKGYENWRVLRYDCTGKWFLL